MMRLKIRNQRSQVVVNVRVVMPGYMVRLSSMVALVVLPAIGTWKFLEMKTLASEAQMMNTAFLHARKGHYMRLRLWRIFRMIATEKGTT